MMITGLSGALSCWIKIIRGLPPVSGPVSVMLIYSSPFRSIVGRPRAKA